MPKILDRKKYGNISCMICDKKLQSDYCTSTVCKECCISGLCPFKDGCKAYVHELEDALRKKPYNPSRRGDLIEYEETQRI